MKFKKNNYLVAIVTVFLLMLLSACTHHATNSNDNNITQLEIENAAVIPVLNGASSQTGVYVRNNSGSAISGISYEIYDAKDKHHLFIVSGLVCQSIPAYSSCLLPIQTPDLAVGDRGSDVIIARHNGKQVQQLINYQYVNSKNYHGVNFSDNSHSLSGANQYATVYAFVGNGQSLANVGFDISNNSIAIIGGLMNGKVDMPANQVVALELQSNPNITSQLITVTPYTVLSHKGKQKATQVSAVNSQLQVTVLTPAQRAHLNLGLVSLLTQDQPTATLTLYNNGNKTATSITVTSDSSNVVATKDTCGSSLAAGASCTYNISLNNNYLSGYATITLSYYNSSATNNQSEKVYYINNYAEPMIASLPTQTLLTESVNTAQSVTYNITNLGMVPLNSVAVSARKSGLTNSNISISNNTCGTSIAANASCQIQLQATAGDIIESGKMYFNLSGTFTGASTTSYSFMSGPVAVSVIDPTIPSITSTTPQDGSTGVSKSTGIIVNFNESMNVTTLTNSTIFLQKTDGTNIPLTSQGVSNNNQTVTFTQTSGQLSDYTDYNIVVNPSLIYNSHGTQLGSATSQTIASFRTADITPPTVVSVTPSNGASNQTQTPAITIGFSESMNQATLTTSNIILQTQAGSVVSGYTISYDSNTYTATVNLNGTLLASQTTYQLIINQANITDIAGNAIGTGNNTISTFTVGDYTAPVLSSVSPLNGATGVAVESGTTQIVLTFSESMNTSTLSATNIQLVRNITSTAVTLGTPSFSNNNQTVTFSLTTNLASQESYSIVINPSAITDVAGNPVSSATSQTVGTFVTAALPATKLMLVGEGGQVMTFDVANNSFSTLSAFKPSYNKMIYSSAYKYYVEVGDYGRIGYSSDGINWTIVQTPSKYSLVDIIYDPSYGLVAVGGSLIVSSRSGLDSWNLSQDIRSLYSAGVYPNISGITYNATSTNSYYYTLSTFSNGTLYSSYSTSGWRVNSVIPDFYGTGTFLSGVANGNGSEVLTFGKSSNSGMASIFSTNDISGLWTRYYNQVSNGTVSAMVYNPTNGCYYAFGYGVNIYSCGNIQSWYSFGNLSNTYGLTLGSSYVMGVGQSGSLGYSAVNQTIPTWTKIQLPTTDELTGVVSQGNQAFVAGHYGQNYWSYTFYDSSQWNTVSPANPIYDMLAVAYDNSTPRNYISIANHPESAGIPSIIYKSSDQGVTWTQKVIPIPTIELLDVTYGNGVFVAVGVSGNIITSSDGGNTWTVVSSSTSNTLSAVKYCNNQFIAVGGNGTILISSTGSNWTSESSGSTATFLNVACSNSQIVVVGTGGSIYYSSTGTSWSKATSVNSYDNFSVAYGNNHFVIGQSGSNVMLTSTGGINWTARTISGATNTNKFTSVMYAGGKFVAFGSQTYPYVYGIAAISADNTESSSWSIMSDYENSFFAPTNGGAAF